MCIYCTQVETRGAQGISDWLLSVTAIYCILHAFQYRAFISLFVHFTWEMLLYISNMLISFCKKYFFYFLTEIMWMYKVRVETVRADCWLCYIILTLCVPIAWLRKWMNDNINILKQSGSMLLIHRQLTMGFDQLCHHKEREILTGRDRNCVDQRWIFVSDSSVCIGTWRTWLY